MKKIVIYIIICLFIPLFSYSNDCNYVMDDNRMERIVQQMQNKQDDNKKMNIIKTYLQRLCLSTEQMSKILNTFESKDAQVEFLAYSKNYITDIENYNKLISKKNN